MNSPTRSQIQALVERMVPDIHEPLRSQVVGGWVNEWTTLLGRVPVEGDISLYVEDANDTVYLVEFAGCATADGHLLPHPHQKQPGCTDVYRLTRHAITEPSDG